jgi:hypothetical protein
MDKSYLPWILLIIAILVIFAQCQKRPDTVIETEVIVDTLTVVDTVTVTIAREKVITLIDTVYVDGHEYTVAKHSETIDTLNVTVDLDIEYWEQDRYFNVRTRIDAESSTVYITETNNVITEKPYPMLSAIAGMAPAFHTKDGKMVVSSVMLDAGVRFAGKYDLSAFGTTAGTYGLRAGIRF